MQDLARQNIQEARHGRRREMPALGRKVPHAHHADGPAPPGRGSRHRLDPVASLELEYELELEEVIAILQCVAGMWMNGDHFCNELK